MSVNKHWNTPAVYAELVYSFFGGPVDLDPATNVTSLIAADRKYCLPDEDGLVLPWDARTIFLN